MTLGMFLLLQDLSLGPIDCTPDPIYTPHTYTLGSAAYALAEALPAPVADVAAAAVGQLPEALVSYLSDMQMSFRPIEGHAIVLAIFASFVAPFGRLRALAVHDVSASMHQQGPLVYASYNKLATLRDQQRLQKSCNIVCWQSSLACCLGQHGTLQDAIFPAAPEGFLPSLPPECW